METPSGICLSVVGDVEDALIDLADLEERAGGSCELSSVRTDLNRALMALRQMKESYE